MATSPKLTLRKVRLSFAQHIFKPKQPDNPEGEPKYSCSYIFDKKKNKAEIELLKKATQDVLVAHYGSSANIPKGVKRPLRDGLEREEIDGYGEGVMFINVSNSKRPLVVNPMGNPVEEKDGVVYSGCYVHATVTLWVQDNSYGKKVNINLRGIVKAADGPKFGEGGEIDANSEFEDLQDEMEAAEEEEEDGEEQDFSSLL